MRRIGAIVAALMLVVSMATVSAAAQPSGRSNSFYANFDLLEYQGTTVVAHVVANLAEPTDDHLVSSTVAIVWTDGPVRESHAQVIETRFWHLLDDPVEGPQNGAFAYGVLCDYNAPQIGSCQPFAMVFVDTLDPAFLNHVGFSVPGTSVCCDGTWYDVGRGAFAMSWVRETP
jgi:hypothetical protein